MAEVLRVSVFLSDLNFHPQTRHTCPFVQPGEEITRIIDDQKHLEQKYQELLQEQSRLKGLSNKTRYKENQAALVNVTNELRQTTQSKKFLSRLSVDGQKP
jgi:hypothetical protein